MLTLLVLYPLSTLLIGALSKVSPLSSSYSVYDLNLSRLISVATHETAQRALLNSFITCGLGSVLAVLIGLSFAWIAERSDTPLRKLIGLIGLFPLFLPPLVAAIAWSLLGSPRTGLLNVLIVAADLPFRVNMFSYEGMIFVYGLYYAPYVFIFTSAALRNMDPSLEEAAAVAGVGPLRTLLTITLPIIAPTIASVALLCFIVTLGVWGVPAILGTQAKIPSITTYIYALFQGNPPDYSGAAAASLYLVLITGAGVLLQRSLHKKRNTVTITGKSSRPRIVSLGRWKYAVLIFSVLYLFISVVLPTLALLFIAFRKFIFVASVSAIFDFGLLSNANFEKLFSDPLTLRSIHNSLIVGVASACFGSLICFLLSYTIIRTKLPGRAVLDVIATLPVAVPSLVIGISYLWAWIAMPIGLYGTLGILILASLARYLPDALKSLSGTMGQVHRELEEAAWVCGDSVISSIWRIILPLVWPGVAAAALLIFVLSIREYGATLFLYNNQTILMPLLLVQLIEVSNLGLVAAFSLIQIGVLISLTLGAWALRLMSRQIHQTQMTGHSFITKGGRYDT
jgi:iron(III) transport system permease protein